MGGKEGSRGYVYQGIVAVLESFSLSFWDKIYVEFPTDDDKVDIALSFGNNIVRAIQVKSTNNTFTPQQIKQWIRDLTNDYPCPNYELVLIGQCSGTARTFINSIEKYRINQMDKKSAEALAGFDTTIFDHAAISVRSLSDDLLSLQAHMRDSLSKYLEGERLLLSYSQIDFIVRAMIADQLLQSTKGEYTDRSEYDKELKKRITLIKQRYDQMRIPLYIQSFSRGADKIPEKAPYLPLHDYFNGRLLKSEFDWNKDVLKSMNDFLTSITNQEDAYEIHLDTHSSIAFASGHILDSKSGVDILPVQKTGTGTHQLWCANTSGMQKYPQWQSTDIRLSYDYFDTALILNVTHNIENDVDQYIKDKQLPIGRKICCSLEYYGATTFSIQDGTHASLLANSVYALLAQRSTAERRAPLHLFAAAPNAFMFFLGRVSRGFGKCILYEYDFEQRDSCSYTPSIQFV